MSVVDDERLARATLAYVAEPGDVQLGRLIARLGPLAALDVVRTGRSPGSVAGNAKERAAIDAAIKRWRVRLPSADPHRDLAAGEKLGARFICPGDVEWPSQLGDLEEKQPYALWLLGPEDLRFGCLRSVAVVGARAATQYGMRVAMDMAAELADRGLTIVSGGAYGIDAAAHRGALAADGLTLAVFANGVDVRYPKQNTGLFTELGETGLLVSESPPGVPPTRLRFLVRNRVIAALTRGTVVVEAETRSGALNTAAYARDLNRSVMIVPGPVTSRMSTGCHEVLRTWPEATCVTDAHDVLDAVGRMGEDMAPERRGPVLARDELDPTSRSVLEAVPARSGAGPAQIAVTAGVDVETVLSRLGRLAATGFIERCDQGWRLRRRHDDRR